MHNVWLAMSNWTCVRASTAYSWSFFVVVKLLLILQTIGFTKREKTSSRWKHSQLPKIIFVLLCNYEIYFNPRFLFYYSELRLSIFTWACFKKPTIQYSPPLQLVLHNNSFPPLDVLSRRRTLGRVHGALHSHSTALWHPALTYKWWSPDWSCNVAGINMGPNIKILLGQEF